MSFFDATTWIGLPRNQPAAAGPVTIGGSAEQLLAEMDRAGIESALVWHIAQADYDAVAGNAMLAQALTPHPRLTGCWSILPTHTGELPGHDLAAWLAMAAESRVRALRAMPAAHGYLLRAEAIGDICEAMIARRMPLILPRRQVEWPAVYDLLADFPKLTVILSDVGWSSERMWRPLVKRYPNCYVETSSYFVSGGIEQFVNDLGPERLIFGSGFPESYLGAAMLALQGAGIPDDAKAAIAGGNLSRLLSAVK